MLFRAWVEEFSSSCGVAGSDRVTRSTRLVSGEEKHCRDLWCRTWPEREVKATCSDTFRHDVEGLFWAE